MLGMIQKIASRQALPDGGACRGGEKRSTALDARSAFRHHDGRGCPNGESAANTVSSAPRPLDEHRSEVGVHADRRRQRPYRATPDAGLLDERIEPSLLASSPCKIWRYSS
jgi:hypothetical protein